MSFVGWYLLEYPPHFYLLITEAVSGAEGCTQFTSNSYLTEPVYHSFNCDVAPLCIGCELMYILLNQSNASLISWIYIYDSIIISEQEKRARHSQECTNRSIIVCRYVI